MNWIQSIVTFASSATGALLAGYLGVYFGRKKLREERAFDRRLAWYENARTVIHDLSDYFARLQAWGIVGRPPSQSLAEIQKEWKKHSLDLLFLADGADLYASEATVTSAWVAFRYAAEQLWTEGFAPEDLAQRSGHLIQLLEGVRDNVVIDARRHMGLEPLSTRAGATAQRIDNSLPIVELREKLFRGHPAGDERWPI